MRAFVFVCLLGLLAASARAAEPSAKDDGYRGLWFTLGQKSEHGDKYSGGLGTYTADHVPMAVHAPAAKKTFFVYGGAAKDRNRLMIMIGCYDHQRGMVSRPTIVRDGGNFGDPHANPALMIDAEGYLWVLSATRHSFAGRKYRSLKPYDIDAFEQVETRYMAYPQGWKVADRGLLMLYTMYTKGRELYWQTTIDGREWTADQKLAGFGGHYAVSWCRDGRVISAFNWHPGGNVDKRTNLYFAQTDDFGKTWKAADGTRLDTPLAAVDNPARVRDYQAEKQLVYIHDINFDRDGSPVILYLTSRDHRPGPAGAPHQWHTARYAEGRWTIRDLAVSDHNYDCGCLHVEADGAWRVIGPTEPGPQKWATGGEMAMWLSRDQGATWRKLADLTKGSKYNHSYARRPLDAQPDFYAFWADGHAHQPSASRLYFTTQSGEVYRLPVAMKDDWAEPERP